MKILSEKMSTGHKTFMGREASFFELTTEIDFGDEKPWWNISTKYFDLDGAQFVEAVRNPADTLKFLRKETRRQALRRVSERLFNAWQLPADSVVLLGNEPDLWKPPT